MQVNAGAGEVARVFLSPNWRQPLSSPASVLLTGSSSSGMASPKTPNQNQTSSRSQSPQSPRTGQPNSGSSSTKSLPPYMSQKESLRRDGLEGVESSSEALSREAQMEMRVTADRRAQAAVGEKLQLRLKVK